MATWTRSDLALYNAKRHRTPPEKIQRQQDSKAEKELHEQVLSWLAMKGVQCIVHSRMDRRTTQERGVPDLIFAIKGRAVALELKVGTNKCTDEQERWLAGAAADGWRTAVCYSLADVIEVWRSLGAT